MSRQALGPAGRNILAILTNDYKSLSSAYKPDNETQSLGTRSNIKDSVLDEYCNGIKLPIRELPFTLEDIHVEVYA